ncbi:DUF3558 domain-containing protein [Lentzea flaviverrucosa]|uniref:DUF3558 domain-containing protein n=1 Tax=Lentzea flaviverrucosa TaxID=200379 RepID=A0A1H9XPE1_9PSEU|nr:DUF3558 domain-containing protein [Lentzea flaviverrucosa]RDI19720.1 uncharacterized protein DUF3558 [Lentzea flaviverrucosa]SES48015.1 Protein of unknown function [Lentzea flaviverrucosa]
MRIRSIAIGTAALALLAGCGDSGGTTGTPTTASQPTSSSNAGEGPKIENPLDVKAFEADPCSTVTPAQVQAFGLPGVAGRVNDTPLSKGCVWLGASTPAKMSPGLAFLPDGTNLSTILPNKDSSYEVFEVQPAIQGYPTYLSLVADDRKKGDCALLVGVSDEKALTFTFQSTQGSAKLADPCAAITEFANLAITTIKAGAK